MRQKVAAQTINRDDVQRMNSERSGSACLLARQAHVVCRLLDSCMQLTSSFWLSKASVWQTQAVPCQLHYYKNVSEWLDYFSPSLPPIQLDRYSTSLFRTAEALQDVELRSNTQ